jgi:hypothetical protein
MGLLDINERIDSVINEEYLNSNNWHRFTNHIISINGELIDGVAWMKKIGTAGYKTELWIRYEPTNNYLYNLNTGERFEATEVMTLDALVEKWLREAGGIPKQNKWFVY